MPCPAASNVLDFLPSPNRSEVSLKLDPKKFKAVALGFILWIATSARSCFVSLVLKLMISESCAKFSQLIIFVLSKLAKIKVFGVLPPK